MYKLLLTDNVEQQVEIFNNVFIKSLEECAPIVTTVIRRPFAPWMSDTIRHAIQIRNNKQNELKKDRQNKPLLEEYKTEKKRVTTLIRNAQSTHFNEQLNSNKGNTAEIWKLLRDIVPNNKCKINQHSFDKVNDKVKEFNIHFANVRKTTYKSAQNTLQE